MEASLQIQRPFSLRNNSTNSKIRLLSGSFSNGRFGISFHSSPGCKEFPGNSVTSLIRATADYPRRRPRKSSNPRPSPKGFMPKTQVGTSIQKRDQNDSGEKESSSPSSSNEYTGPGNKLTETKADAGEEQMSEFVPETSLLSNQVKTITDVLGEAQEETDEIEEKKDETPSMVQHSPTINSHDIVEKGTMAGTDEDKAELGAPEILKKVDVVVDKEPDVEEALMKEKLETEARAGNETLMKQKLEMEARARAREEALMKWKLEMEAREREEALVKEKLEMEARAREEALMKQKLEMEARARKKLLEELAEENFSVGNKLFVHPQVVKPDQSIEVFLNRSLSTLKGESDVLIMGAFNDWRWKSFTKKMQKTDLKGDWWSCQVDIPKEAYNMDFVFFNGGDVYENNSSKDFFIPVESGMDASAFENFLLEEKRRELERLAAEEAERERQAEEQRRLEAEKAASEADRAQAKMEIEKRRKILFQLMKKAEQSVDNVWYIEPSEFKGEDMVKFYYNRSSGPLAQAEEVWIHGGHNNWKDGLTIVERLICAEKDSGDWWYADVVVPDRSLVVDWVFADGPPQSAKVYDNNNYEDFHATVPNRIPEELYWVEEEHQIYKRLQEERKQREEAIRAKAEKTARLKAEAKEKTMKMFLLSQKHIVYTEPLEVRAGMTVTVFYNPSNTVLNGKPEVWFRCSFNRWTHRNGPLPPKKMTPAENGPHVKVTVKVPLDAYMMDFVFSEKEDGGIYDNKNGMDYHIPVVGGVNKTPPMHIVHVAVEMAPIAKVGGLGDVVTSLSRAVQDLGHNVEIILPKYDCMNLSNVKDFQFNRSYHWGGTEIKVWYGKVEGLSVYFIEPQNGMFWAGCIYGCRNDGERFGFFCHAALEFLLQSGAHPDILHCHDWSSAPVAWLFKDNYMHYGLSGARVVFTIHNLEFGAGNIGKAMAYADKATTVSPNYSREVSGNPVIAHHLHKFHGILNGIDPDIWDPYNDKFIPISYTSENVVEGKRAAKLALQQRLGLKTSDRPLVGIISRLTAQKGIHLIKHAILRTLERDGQVVLLGSAPDPRIQNDFVNLANQLHSTHGDRARLCLTYDEPLSHLIYAGSDFILVPSIFEPCGLTQLTAMRYGSIPVVRKTGGLYDTVFDVDHDKERAQAIGIEPNGFSFDGADSSGVDYALNRAITAWYEGQEWFNSLCKRVMEQDWSWNRPALDYMELYYSACK
ncbi:starch synthase 3, chloroplastic/amyloplastic [Magnolia sinica]|uniref:starch synthase 3, chloroplastic/amyloplastic n=1 Tax=Magnolia sinica TaxID=86752 RepID=UPI00265A3C88|nr:starch synthase 3, chloroplastic/amyloplastic [Magnolia sinica]